MDTSTASFAATGTPAVLSRNASEPLAQQLAQRFAARIHQRLLLPGARLPSVRDCARHHGVSPYTVVAAYDQLLAQGLLEARKKRGFFVRETRPQPARLPGAGRPPALGARCGAASRRQPAHGRRGL